MSATSILSPGQTPEFSSTITVAAGSSVAVAVYTDTGVEVPSGVSLQLFRQTLTGAYQPFYTYPGGPVYLSQQLTVYLITIPGTYQFKRENISAYGVNVGIEQGS